ncbi:LCP family protein [Desulfitobacterium sp. THU1]|uniref:LCP family protein n=1 Tax=Desulfitobacterium sp. THU1 TaxID=3138072 RepID=UPI00311E211B
MRDNKKWKRIIHSFQVYGFNAIIGFGLGIVIVFVILAFSRNQINVGQEAQGSNTQTLSSQERSSSQLSEQIQRSEGTEPQDASEQLLSQNSLPIDTSSDIDLKDRFTVLLVGMDNRPGEIISNTDTLIVASLDQKAKKMVLLSIPRDTQVMLNKKKEKINALARLGKGPISTQQYIQELIGTPIDGYVLTDFQGFKNIVDSLGGITINVEKDMYHDTGDDKDRYIDLKKGSQRLNGAQALQYARYRNDKLADISRASRQQEVIKAIVAEATMPRNLPKLPIIIPKVYQAIETNLNLGQVWSLVVAFKNKDTYAVINQTLPGQFSDEEGISYWRINPKESIGILNELFQGRTTPIFDNIRKVQAPAQKPVVDTKKADSEAVPILVEVLKPGNDSPSAEGNVTSESEITFEVLE